MTVRYYVVSVDEGSGVALAAEIHTPMIGANLIAKAHDAGSENHGLSAEDRANAAADALRSIMPDDDEVSA